MKKALFAVALLFTISIAFTGCREDKKTPEEKIEAALEEVKVEAKENSEELADDVEDAIEDVKDEIE
tara:strand:+ start:5366 stop:5566 length:201 start_codon:yes stop_codon:yes gene_type:complete